MQNYKRPRARSRFVAKEQKETSWRFCSELLVKRSGNQSVKLKANEFFPLLVIYGKMVNCSQTKKRIANLLASNISKHSSAENYSPCFQKIKEVKEKKRLNFSDNQEDYYLPFSLIELSLQKSNDSATGLDKVHYQLPTHLPDTSLSVLQVFNNI